MEIYPGMHLIKEPFTIKILSHSQAGTLIINAIHLLCDDRVSVFILGILIFSTANTELLQAEAKIFHGSPKEGKGGLITHAREIILGATPQINT